METMEIYASEGGFRVAWAIWAGSPVINCNTPWYETREQAQAAIEQRRREAEKQSEIDDVISAGYSWPETERMIAEIRSRYA